MKSELKEFKNAKFYNKNVANEKALELIDNAVQEVNVNNIISILFKAKKIILLIVQILSILKTKK